jgi:hypothetical protein
MNKVFYDDQKGSLPDIVGLEQWPGLRQSHQE